MPLPVDRQIIYAPTKTLKNKTPLLRAIEFYKQQYFWVMVHVID